MRRWYSIVALLSLLVLSSCIEIIDDLTLNLDGSGTLKYNVNLSSSKVKINSILALDSLDGKKVPSIADIKSKVGRIETQLNEQEGITNAQIISDYDNFIFRLSCDFESLPELQSALESVIANTTSSKSLPEMDYNWLVYTDTTLQRSIPDITVEKSKEIKESDRARLKDGTYTSITRFEEEIDHFDNENAILSANKKAIMIRTDPYSLTQNPQLLDNLIYLKKSQE